MKFEGYPETAFRGGGGSAEIELARQQKAINETREVLMKFAEATEQRMTEHAHQINMQWVVIGVMLVAYLGLIIRWSML